MLNVTGKGYAKKVKTGYSDGNWYLGFFIEVEDGSLYLCKTFLIQYKDLVSGSCIAILEGVMRTFKKESVSYDYIEVTDMEIVQDKFYQAQKQAIARAHKLK